MQARYKVAPKMCLTINRLKCILADAKQIYSVHLEQW